MDFSLTKEQQDFRKAAREFAEKEFPQVAQQCDEQEKMDMSLLKKARELGFVGVNIPEQYGGFGMNYLEKGLITEEFWRVDPGVGHAILSATFGSEVIMEHGTEAQKQKYLPPLIEGDAIFAGAITEPDAGSDVTSVETKAVREGNEYIINGTKMFITNGSIATFLIVFCRTNFEKGDPHSRFSCLLVEPDRKGFQANKLKNKLGIRASDTAELVFDNVRVPAENLIGREGDGFRQILTLFNRERTAICAQATGLAQGALDQAVKHISRREQFGKKIASFQAVRFKIAELATLVEANRSMYYRACWSIDSGEEDHRLIAMAKWFCAQNAVSVAQECLQLHGGYGFLNEYPIARFYRDSKILEIYEGTKEIEKVVISNAILGKKG
jgi:acyl-CoA dehydrogenase